MFALFSLSKKEGCENLAKVVAKHRDILATSGTAEYLKSKGIEVKKLSELTGIVEKKTLKTLHPVVFEMIESGEIDLVVVNLYSPSSIENIDVGGVALIRAAAKNYKKVLVVCKPEQYSEVAKNFPKVDKLKLKYACEAFKHTSEYDRIISDWLCKL